MQEDLEMQIELIRDFEGAGDADLRFWTFGLLARSISCWCDYTDVDLQARIISIVLILFGSLLLERGSFWVAWRASFAGEVSGLSVSVVFADEAYGLRHLLSSVLSTVLS